MKLVRWPIRWTGQDLNLFLFGLVAAMCASPVIGTGLWLEDLQGRLGELPMRASWAMVGGELVLLLVALAGFTACLGNQLEAHPLNGPSKPVDAVDPSPGDRNSQVS